MRTGFWFLTLAAYLFATTQALADCMGRMPRFMEMTVESCSGAGRLAQSSIQGKGYSEQEKGLVDVSAKFLFIIRARQLADVDIVEWYSKDAIRRYRGARKPIEDVVPHDYLVMSLGGCEQLMAAKPLIFNLNAEKPCRDFKVTLNGEEAKETDARLLITVPEVSYFPDQEALEDIQSLDKRLQGTIGTHAL
jgi:hypothetical protein